MKDANSSKLNDRFYYYFFAQGGFHANQLTRGVEGGGGSSTRATNLRNISR